MGGEVSVDLDHKSTPAHALSMGDCNEATMQHGIQLFP
jgi:hypothetical protein